MREIKFSLIFITFSMIFFLNLTEIDDPDFFWHIKTGEKIVKEGFIKKDPFSWSFPQKKWVNHEWLSQVLFFEVKKNFGFFSLVLLKAILNTFTFFLVFYWQNKNPPQWYGARILFKFFCFITEIAFHGYFLDKVPSEKFLIKKSVRKTEAEIKIRTFITKFSPELRENFVFSDERLRCFEAIKSRCFTISV